LQCPAQDRESKPGEVQIVEEENNNRPGGAPEPVYDSAGRLLGSGRDVCDCLEERCPGCHLPCPACSSAKCGHACRAGRAWQYDWVEVEGQPDRKKINSNLTEKLCKPK
jgi:hypothetical protein